MATVEILVVEDDPDIREVMCEIFALEGFKTCSASSGKEALEILRKNPSLKVIFLDMIMPEMDGKEFLRIKNESPVLAEIPVVITSASRSGTSFAGVKEHLPKPLSLEKLIETASRYIAGLSIEDSEKQLIPEKA